jgi:acid phosphatase
MRSTMPLPFAFPVALWAAAFAAACSGAPQNGDAMDCPAVQVVGEAAAPAMTPEPLLAVSATLWTQTSLEFAALSTAVFQSATAQLDDALQDPEWSALAPHEYALIAMDGEANALSTLPAAVIVDLDETILDNSPYQAWRIAAGVEYSPDSWNAWASEGAAGFLPGALEFLQACDEAGVTVFYVSNRYASTEAATVENLLAAGLDLGDEPDERLLLREEIDAWSSSDKTPRRLAVAATHRIIMMAGDAFGDFFEPDSVEDPVGAYAGFWGERWFVLPNAQYGGWNRIAADESGDLLAPRIEALDVWDGPATE